MNPDLLLFLRLWTENTPPEEVPEEERIRLLSRLRSDAPFRAECVEELVLLGHLKASQSPVPRWLDLSDALRLSAPADCGASQSGSEFTRTVMQQIERVQVSERTDAHNRVDLRRLWAIAAAVALLLSVGVGAWWSRGLPLEIVEVSESSGSSWRAGDPVRARRLVWLRGTLVCRLRSGAQLTIEGPAELEFRSAMEVRLISGKVTADVGEQAKGFVIETPQSRVVDLGTVFGVDASQTAKTDVVVFKGQVQVYERERPADAILLNRGEGIRIERHRRSSRIVSVSDSEESGSWSAQSHARETCSVRTVHDSMVVNDDGAKRWPSLRNFYRIVPGGMRDGALAFSDSSDVWREVPAELLGADQVRTFAVDGFNWWMKLTLELRRPSRLFVLVDRRNPAPEWVRREFTDTGKMLKLDFKLAPAGGHVARQLPYAIWERRVEAAGSVVLGAPYENPPEDRKSFHPNRMFGVVVQSDP